MGKIKIILIVFSFFAIAAKADIITSSGDNDYRVVVNSNEFNGVVLKNTDIVYLALKDGNRYYAVGGPNENINAFVPNGNYDFLIRSNGSYSIDIGSSVVPEPAFGLVALGLMGLGRRKATYVS